MDQFGFEQLAAWLSHRVSLPPGRLFCVINGPTRGRRWSATAARAEPRQLAVDAGVRRRFAPHQLRHAHAVELAREGVAINIIQRQLGHTDLSARDRSQRDHRRRPLTPPADDLRHRRIDPLMADHDDSPPAARAGGPSSHSPGQRSDCRQPRLPLAVPRPPEPAARNPTAQAATSRRRGIWPFGGSTSVSVGRSPVGFLRWSNLSSRLRLGRSRKFGASPVRRP
jgi:Phage integrase family